MFFIPTMAKIEAEVNNYETLGFFRKSKNLLITFILVTEAIWLYRVSNVGSDNFVGLLIEPALISIIAGFIYLNHRWAIVTFIIYYMIDKFLVISSLPATESGALGGTILSAILIIISYSSFRVATILKREGSDIEMTKKNKIQKLFIFVSLSFLLFVTTIFGTVYFSGESFAKQTEYDTQRLADILAISDMVEAYYEINNHYPWVQEPQLETINIFISDNIPEHYPSGAPYQLLEADLQKTLGNDAVLPKDPADDGSPYQYATNGKNYYVAAYLYHSRSYAWEQARHANKIEVTNSPSLQNRSYRPNYLRHVLRFGPDDASKQAEFFEALQEHKFDAAAVMLKDGANPSPTCALNYRCQPLATAAMDGDLEVMKFLIDNGADLDGYNSFDDVALIYALENQQIEAAKFLVESGANVNIPNIFGFSPFVGAPASGDVELLTLMIQNGAELDKNFHIYVGDPEPGDMGPLPLEFAIKYDQPEIVSLLLGAGADPFMHTSSGETITELGRKSDSEAIRQLF
jgi:hypothetical protein